MNIRCVLNKSLHIAANDVVIGNLSNFVKYKLIWPSNLKKNMMSNQLLILKFFTTTAKSKLLLDKCLVITLIFDIRDLTIDSS